jgi:hypothetical protein
VLSHRDNRTLNVLALVSDTLNVAFNAMALPCIHSCVGADISTSSSAPNAVLESKMDC